MCIYDKSPIWLGEVVQPCMFDYRLSKLFNRYVENL